MGKMIDGQWYSDADIAKVNTSGEYQREDSQLRHWIGDPLFPAENNRYHLYVAYNCPWAHRTLIMRAVKKLEAVISTSFVAPKRNAQGWVFGGPEYQDDLHHFASLHQIYSYAMKNYTGRITVPVLWDKKQQTIVSNESADIIRMLNSAFNAFTDVSDDFYPAALQHEIDTWNDKIYRDVNNGVYRAGFATSQSAYDDAVVKLFEVLEEINSHLASHPYLAGEQLTEADWRLLPTLVRFDVAYYGAFKCNIKRLVDFPQLWKYARRLYHYPGIAATVKFDIYKQGYFSKSEKRNPFGILPVGPVIDWSLD